MQSGVYISAEIDLILSKPNIYFSAGQSEVALWLF